LPDIDLNISLTSSKRAEIIIFINFLARRNLNAIHQKAMKLDEIGIPFMFMYMAPSGSIIRGVTSKVSAIFDTDEYAKFYPIFEEMANNDEDAEENIIISDEALDNTLKEINFDFLKKLIRIVSRYYVSENTDLDASDHLRVTPVLTCYN
jgi:hypothetical protein